MHGSCEDLTEIGVIWTCGADGEARRRPRLAPSHGASGHGNEAEPAPLATALKRVRVLIYTHSLPVALVLMAAIGTGLQSLLVGRARQILLSGGGRASGGAATTASSAQAHARAAAEDKSVLDLEQLSLRDCTLAGMKKLRIRIADLDEALASRAGQQSNGAPSSVADLMQAHILFSKSNTFPLLGHRHMHRVAYA
jgi:hypothetical protein